MAYLTNSAVNRVNVHYAIQAFASAAAGTFLLVYFVRAGLSLPGSLLALAAIIFGRFVSRPFVLPIAKRFGLKATLIIGTLLLACQYPVAAYIDGVSVGLVLRCVFSALGDAFYWTSYHSYFASLGDSEHRGHQISAREAIVALIGIVAPIVGTWGMVTLGPTCHVCGGGICASAGCFALAGVAGAARARDGAGRFRSGAAGGADHRCARLVHRRLHPRVVDCALRRARQELRVVRRGDDLGGTCGCRRRAVARQRDRCGARGARGRLCVCADGFGDRVAGHEFGYALAWRSVPMCSACLRCAFMCRR